MTRAGTSTRPDASPDALVTSGPFRFSRNPFYIGVLLMIGGLMLALSLDWLVVALPLLWVALDRLVVPREEERLAAAFDETWEPYAARTRRWL